MSYTGYKSHICGSVSNIKHIFFKNALLPRDRSTNMGTRSKSIFVGPFTPKPRLVFDWLIDWSIVASWWIEYNLMASC